MYHSFFIHSSTDGHLNHFQILADVNNAAMNIGVHIFFLIGVLGFLGYIAGSGIAGSNGCSIFRIWFCFLDREGKGGRKKGRETSYMQQLGTEPATQACALTRNQTSYHSVCRTTPKQTTPAGALWSIFCGNYTQFSTVAAPVRIPTRGTLGVPFLHSLASTCCLLLYWW